MRDFKFFRKEVNPSIYSDTPEGYMNRRMLYHTDPMEYQRRFSARQEVIRRMNGGLSQEEILRRRHQSFQSKSETKWRVELTFKKLFWEDDVINTVLVSTVSTLSMILILTKILNVW
jgi:hypothetical protein